MNDNKTNNNKTNNTNNKKPVYAVILAGGTGSRMGSAVPKQFLELAGRPVLAYSMIAFQKSDAEKIIVVAHKSYRDLIEKEIVATYGIDKFAGFADNGDERVVSVENGVNAAAALAGSDDIYLMIHDGARPLVSSEFINKCIKELEAGRACVPGLALKDTIKRVGSESEVLETPDRSEFSAVQTPQCFEAGLLLQAYKAYANYLKSEAADFIPTDDASLVERFTGVNVYVIPGDERNIKITTPIDMKVAEMLLDQIVL